MVKGKKIKVDDEEEEEEEIEEIGALSRSIRICTPYTEVVIASESKEDTIEVLKNNAVELMDKYRNYHRTQ